THQFATMFQQSVANMATKTVTAANDPAVRQFLHSPLARSHAGALAALQSLAVPQDQGSWQVELWDANPSLSLAIPEGSSPLSPGIEMEFTKAAAGPPFSAVGEIRVIGEQVAYPLVIAVQNDGGRPLGYLVRWRRLTATAEARQRLLDLIGTQAALYLGN